MRAAPPEKMAQLGVRGRAAGPFPAPIRAYGFAIFQTRALQSDESAHGLRHIGLTVTPKSPADHVSDVA